MAFFSRQLSLAAAAVPIQALSSPNTAASTPAGTASGGNGPRRRGVIPSTSLRAASGLDAEHPAGARRPFPQPEVH
jgi:hypothetical protein